MVQGYKYNMVYTMDCPLMRWTSSLACPDIFMGLLGGDTASLNTHYKYIQSIFYGNMVKLREFEERCIKYDIMGALIIP